MNYFIFFIFHFILKSRFKGDTTFPHPFLQLLSLFTPRVSHPHATRRTVSMSTPVGATAGRRLQ